MRLLSWILKLALFVAALGFALFNTAPVDLHFFGSAVSWSAPLVIFLLLFFAAGAAFGLLAVVPTLFRQRRELGRLRRELKLIGPGVAPAQDPASAIAAGMTPPPDGPAPRAGGVPPHLGV